MSNLHIGLICPPLLGHLNPTIVLAKELKRSGYRVSLLSRPCHNNLINQSGLNHIVYGKSVQSLKQVEEDSGTQYPSTGLESVKNMISTMSLAIESSFDELAHIFNDENIELIIADHVLVEVPTICEYLELPFITLCNAMVTRFNLKFPSSYYLGEYSNNFWNYISNAVGYFKYAMTARSLTSKIVKQRKEWNLKQSAGLKGIYSPISVICQQTTDLEYPLDNFVRDFNFVGPLIHNEQVSDFKISKYFDTDRPLIYASLGTIRNDNYWIYKIISDCVQSMEFNLLISLGKPISDQDLELRSSNVAIEPFVNQIDVLNYSSLCITHAGMNTTMHCVYTATPMIAIPIANEQPGIASRIQYSRSGVAIGLRDLSIKSLKVAINEVYSNPLYRLNMLKYKENCVKSGGVEKAIEIINSVVSLIST